MVGPTLTKGVFTLPGGDSYEGHFVQGSFEGFGIYVWTGDKKYVGDWKDGKMHGKGRLDYNNGDFFDGFFHKGKKYGKGTYKWAKDNSYYEGEWTNNVPHGIGYVGKENQPRRKAMYENGVNVTWLDHE